MKFVIHQTTLHLSFKIKCCVDRLRPPTHSGRWGRLARERDGCSRCQDHQARRDHGW